VVTHQLKVEHATGKVRQPRPTFYHCATPREEWSVAYNLQGVTRLKEKKEEISSSIRKRKSNSHSSSSSSSSTVS